MWLPGLLNSQDFESWELGDLRRKKHLQIPKLLFVVLVSKIKVDR